MAKNSKEKDFDEVMKDLYYFLKFKLKFDDFQASTFIFSMFSIPLTLILGFNSDSLVIFEVIFYFTVFLAMSCIIYSVLKFKKKIQKGKTCFAFCKK